MRNNNDSSTGTGQAALYPIRKVAELTGVHPVTLRAWERRYHLIVPTRTAKGHRLYTESDIERIREVVRRLAEGVSVSQVKKLLDEAGAAVGSPPTEPARGPWDAYVERMLDAVRVFDEMGLDAIYNDALSLYPIDLVSRHLTTPVLQRLGAEWREEGVGIAREHFFSQFLRNKLGARFHHLNNRATGPRVLCACPEGEHHELGLLQFALAAATHGYRLILLGGNVPVEEIAMAARLARSSAILVSTSANLRQSTLRDRLSRLVEATAQPVLVGGDGSEKWPEAVRRSGAVPVGNDFQDALAELGQAVSHR